jgi:hypothetical protein
MIEEPNGLALVCPVTAAEGSPRKHRLGSDFPLSLPKFRYGRGEPKLGSQGE